MAYFPDLTPHTYVPTCGAEVLNIGWLDEDFTFPVRETSAPFRAALKVLCTRPIHLHRGFHACWYCLRLSRVCEGNGQIRVRGENGIWFAAPTLVHHYVTCHKYSPPTEFIDAVLLTVDIKILASTTVSLVRSNPPFKDDSQHIAE